MTTHHESNPAADERLASWKSTYQITNDVDAYLLRELVSYSLLLDQTRDEERALLKAETLDAQHNWDASRRLDAAKIGTRLARNPELNALKLRQTKQGVDWLLTRWTHLADLLKRGESWTDKQRKLALDLTGLSPDLRDPAHIILDPAALAQRELSTLTALRDGPLADLDAHARDCSLKGNPLDPSRALQAVRRRHATLTRLFHNTQKLLEPCKPPKIPVSAPHQPLPNPPTPTPGPCGPHNGFLPEDYSPNFDRYLPLTNPSHREIRPTIRRINK